MYIVERTNTHIRFIITFFIGYIYIHYEHLNLLDAQTISIGLSIWKYETSISFSYHGIPFYSKQFFKRIQEHNDDTK